MITKKSTIPGTDLHVIGSSIGRLDNDLDPTLDQLPDVLRIQGRPPLPNVDCLPSNGHDLGPIRQETLGHLMVWREDPGTNLLCCFPPHPWKVKDITLDANCLLLVLWSLFFSLLKVLGLKYSPTKSLTWIVKDKVFKALVVFLI